MKDFKDKVAVVTGAASGIGRGMVEVFVAAGMKVVLSDIDAQALEETTRSLLDAGADVHSVVTDVSKAEQVNDLARQTLSKYGAVHVLCNNAGIFIGDGASWKSPLDDWRWIVGVNLMGVVHGIHSFLPIMIEQDSEAHIVNTASMGGLIAGGSAPYGATKSAVVGLTENLYIELRRGGFKPNVSVLCPGIVNTNIMNSRSHRPAEFGGSPAPQAGPASVAQIKLRDQAAEVLKKAMSPRAVGDQVLGAIRDERLYVLTHPELNAYIELRARNIVNGENPIVPVRPN